MRFHVGAPTILSRAMHRISGALEKYAPTTVRVVAASQRADVVVIYSIGYDCTLKEINSLRPGQRYVIVQCCLRTTQRPHCSSWLPLWRGAALVWSYYDLPRLCREDGVESDFPFYHSPLGVDHSVFTNHPEVWPDYSLFSSGYVAETECVREAVEATGRIGGKLFHLGPNLGFPSHVTYKLGIEDSTLAAVYRRCEFVAGLRRVEGFELPAAEGLLCGARPIMFDQPHYREWFGPWAEFIPETTPELVAESLTTILKSGPRVVVDREIREATEVFSWSRIASEFWRRAA